MICAKAELRRHHGRRGLAAEAAFRENEIDENALRKHLVEFRLGFLALHDVLGDFGEAD